MARLARRLDHELLVSTSRPSASAARSTCLVGTSTPANSAVSSWPSDQSDHSARLMRFSDATWTRSRPRPVERQGRVKVRRAPGLLHAIRAWARVRSCAGPPTRRATRARMVRAYSFGNRCPSTPLGEQISKSSKSSPPLAMTTRRSPSTSRTANRATIIERVAGLSDVFFTLGTSRTRAFQKTGHRSETFNSISSLTSFAETTRVPRSAPSSAPARTPGRNHLRQPSYLLRLGPKTEASAVGVRKRARHSRQTRREPVVRWIADLSPGLVYSTRSRLTRFELL